MVNLSVKNVPDVLAEKLRLRAEQNHRSLQGELMAILESAVEEPGNRMTVRELMRKVAEYRIESPSESAQLVREMRDQRGEQLMSSASKGRKRGKSVRR
jgi:plasmid stability protein